MRNKLSVMTSVFICVVFGLLFFPIPQNAQLTFPLYVNTTSDNVVVGACQAGVPNPGCSLRGAIMKANESAGADVIFISMPASDPFCSAGVCTINLSQPLPTISTSMSINGPGADKLTVKAATGVQTRIFSILGSVSTISNLTISNGFANAGAGVSSVNASVTITNCVISGNSATGSGGGLFQTLGQMTVSNSTVTGNSAPAGSGIHNSDGISNVISSTINNNTGSGSGIRNSGGIVNVTNSTVAVNDASSGGGGIASSGGTVNVKSTIIALNSGGAASPDVSGNFVSAGFNLIGKRDGGNGFTAATDQTGTIASPLDAKLISPQNNGGPTRTMSLLSGSPAIDKGSSNGLTGILTTDQRGTGFPRTDDLGVSNAVGGDGTDIGAFERRESPADFDGDGRMDIGIFRPAPGQWWLNLSLSGATFVAQFGNSTDKLVPGDYTGDGRTDIAIWRPATGTWFVLRSENATFFSVPFGLSGDIPASADFDADGKTDTAVFRPSSGTWFIQRSSDNGTTIQGFGVNGDVPVVADYDGDGRADIAIFRPSAGQWWLLRSTAGVIAVAFGNSTDKQVQGNYTGDGKTDVALWRPSTGEWFVLRSEDFSFFSVPFGLSTDIPAPGDYDGDGRYDTTVFRPSSGTWFVERTSAGTLILQFGVNGDRPVANAFVP